MRCLGALTTRANQGTRDSPLSLFAPSSSHSHPADGAVSHQQQHWQQQQRQRQQQPTAAQDQRHHQPMTGYDRRDQPMTAHDRRDRSDWQQYHEGEGPGRSGGDGDSGRPRPQTAGRADHDRANGYPTDNRRVPDGYPNPGVIKYRRAAAPSQHDAGPSHYPGGCLDPEPYRPYWP